MNDRDHDLDAEFERIIAGWDDEAPDPLPVARHDPSTDDAPDSAPDSATDSAPDVATDDRDADPDGSADGAEEAARPSDAARPPAPSSTPDGTPASTPASPPAKPTAAPPSPAGTGGLGLPIAPTTSHVWRGSEPVRDDVDDLLEDPDDHFVPPETELPSAEDDPMFWAIVGGLVGGPLLLLWVVLFDRDGSGWWVVTGSALIVVGFVLLVLRGGTERDPFDDGTRV